MANLVLEDVPALLCGECLNVLSALIVFLLCVLRISVIEQDPRNLQIVIVKLQLEVC
jgi:hypothetical protein